MGNRKKIIIGTVQAVFILVALASSIGFTDRTQDERLFEDVIITIENQFDNYFIDQDDILDIMTREGQFQLAGSYLANVDLRRLEKILEAEKFIRKAQIFRDLQGNMIVKVDQRRPIARILRTGAEDAYIDEEGEVLPISPKFTARVMLVSGAGAELLADNQLTEMDRSAILELLEFINSDPFWRAQIAQVEVTVNQDISFFTQVSKQVVEFGKAEQLELKFKKLTAFYKRILPYKGWNSYERVSLKYDGQIICE